MHQKVRLLDQNVDKRDRMGQPPKKPMATASSPTCSTEGIVDQLKRGLEKLPAVESVHFMELERSTSVWIGLRGDDGTIRKAVYSFEDEVSELFPDVLFDFHVVALPQGQRMEDFVSTAQPVFRRAA